MSAARSGVRPVASAAFAVALRAKCGTVTTMDVDGLRADAEAHLPEGHPLRAAVMRFATRYEADRYFPVELIAAGDELARAVDLALMPVPPDLQRSDIHG